MLKGFQIVILAVLTAVLYGVVNNQVTARICFEFFTIFPIEVNSPSPTIVAIIYGVISTWWLGAILGVIMALAARLGDNVKLEPVMFLRPLTLVFFGLGLVSLIFGFFWKVYLFS